MMLCTVSYTGIKASGVLYQTIVGIPRSDTMNEEANINFYNVLKEFYKFCVTVRNDLPSFKLAYLRYFF